MRFVDEAVITVEAGDGGNGVASFRRENLYHLVAQMVVMADVVEVSIFKLMTIQVR